MQLVVWQAGRTGAARLAALLNAAGRGCLVVEQNNVTIARQADVLLLTGGAFLQGQPPHLLVLGTAGKPYQMPSEAPQLVLLDGADAEALSVCAPCKSPVVTAGLRTVDTVSYSSTDGGRCLVSINRPLPLLKGQPMQEQELAVSAATTGVETLLVVSAALVLGVSPLQLERCKPV